MNDADFKEAGFSGADEAAAFEEEIRETSLERYNIRPAKPGEKPGISTGFDDQLSHDLMRLSKGGGVSKRYEANYPKIDWTK